MVQLRPGWIIRDCARAFGGVEYDCAKIREQSVNHGQGTLTEHRTKKIVDHVEYVTAMDAVVKKVDYVLRKHCAHTLLGWFCDNAAKRVVMAEVAQLQREAEILNAQAEADKRTARRVKIRVVPLRLDLTLPEATQEITETIRDLLIEIRDALRAGRIDEIHKLRIRARNLDKLVMGSASDAIRLALERVPRVAKELREQQRRLPPEASAEGAKKLDLEAIETAIAYFAPDHGGRKIALDK